MTRILNIMIRRPPILILLVLGAGSTVLAQQPPVKLPPAAPPAQSSVVSQSELVLPPVSPPLSLSAVTTTALQQVSSLRQAQIDEAIAAEDLRQARAALLPRLRSSSSFTYNSPARLPADPKSPSFIAANAIREYQELLGVTGDLDYGRIASVRRSRALLDAARAGTEVARRGFLRGVNEIYYGAALAAAKRQAAEESLRAAQEFERVTNLNYQAGEVPEVDLIRARLLTAARRDELEQASQADVIASAALGTLLGYDLKDVPPIESLPQTVDDSEIMTFTAEGVMHRPELTQAEAQLRAARADLGIARGTFLPSLVYSADEGFDTDSLHSAELRQHRGVLATATLDIPLFDWGSSLSKHRQARLRQTSAELQRDLKIRELNLQFVSSRQEALTAASRVENACSALADAERNVSISIARYRAGEAPISEATDAQTTLSNQRLTLQQALFDYQIARARLREAAGQ